jgi:hypothetical protein
VGGCYRDINGGEYKLVSHYVKWTRSKIDKFENSTLSMTLRAGVPDTSD